jgi:hypothetical protein
MCLVPYISGVKYPELKGAKIMGQILHGTATTTHAVREKIQNAEEGISVLAERYHIKHRTTLVKRPWTNGMVEAMNKKVKANTTKRFHYDNVGELKSHPYHYLLNYNFNLKLRAIGRKTPFGAVLSTYYGHIMGNCI